MHGQLTIFGALKECSQCGANLPAKPEFFSKYKQSKDGLRTACRECRKHYKGSVKVFCAECGAVCFRRPSGVKPSNYCSAACSHKTPHNKGTAKIVSKPCMVCGEAITGRAWKIKRRKVCSGSCWSAFNSGANHYGWRGGVGSERKQLFNKGVYRDWRRTVIVRDGGVCLWCKAKGKINRENLEVHHIVPFYADANLVLEISNAITLCRPHHVLTRGKESVFADQFRRMMST